MSIPDSVRIRAIIANVFQVAEEELNPSSSPDTIETWDSLQHLNMVLALEEEFTLQFTPEEIEQMLSVELIVLLVEEKLKACKVAYAD